MISLSAPAPTTSRGKTAAPSACDQCATTIGASSTEAGRHLDHDRVEAEGVVQLGEQRQVRRRAPSRGSSRRRSSAASADPEPFACQRRVGIDVDHLPSTTRIDGGGGADGLDAGPGRADRAGVDRAGRPAGSVEVELVDAAVAPHLFVGRRHRRAAARSAASIRRCCSQSGPPRPAAARGERVVMGWSRIGGQPAPVSLGSLPAHAGIAAWSAVLAALEHALPTAAFALALGGPTSARGRRRRR